MTPKELDEMVEGYNNRVQEKYDEIIYQAWFTASLMRAKRVPSLRKLLAHKNKNNGGKKLTKEEYRNEWESLKRKLESKKGPG